MNKTSVTNFFKSIGTSMSKHSPEILTGIGIAGMVSTTVLAVKATPKAIDILNEVKAEEETDKLPAKEVIGLTWKCYIPSVVTGAVSIACLIGANSVNAKRNAALATAYKLSEEALSIYKEKVIETIGENKEKEIRGKVNQERLDRDPVSSKEVIISGSGEELFYDVMSSRYFKSSVNAIDKAVNLLNKRMRTEMYISLSEFYDELGLSHTRNSDEIGWNIDREGYIEIDYDAKLIEDGSKSCIVLDYYVAPRYDFSKLS